MNQLSQSLADCCRQHLLHEKWLLAPTLRVGHQWLESVARSGQPVVNARVMTVKSMAVDLAARELAALHVTLASARASAMLVDQTLRTLQRQGELQYLPRLETSVGLSQAVLSSLQALRLAGLSATELRGDRFEVPSKAADLTRILGSYLALLQADKLVDYAEVLQIAIGQLGTSAGAMRSDTLVLLPGDLELQGLERRLLDTLPKDQRQLLEVDRLADPALPPATANPDRERLRWLLAPDKAPAPCGDQTVRIVRSVGEVNEIRAVLRQIVEQQIPLDAVELLHTDTSTYVPLVYELLATLDWPGGEPGDELPVTFTEGVPCLYSRPGRALVYWAQWAQQDFAQVLLVKMLKEGLVKLPASADEQARFSRLANLLRGLAIGRGRERHLDVLGKRIAAVQSRLEHPEQAKDEDGDAAESAMKLQRELQDLRQLQGLFHQILNEAPAADAPPQQVVAAARKYLETSARSVNKLDQFAAAKLVGELADMEYWLSRPDGASNIDVWQWLAGLPGEARVLGSGPRPGCLHVDSLLAGGHSGRTHTFLVGLDDSRFPGAGMQDPLLLDRERQRLSPEIPTAAHRLEESLERFGRLLVRLRGQVTLSFSGRNLAENDDREQFASPALLAVHRLLSGNPDANLLDSLPTAESFAPDRESRCLSRADWWLWRLTAEQAPLNYDELLAEQFPHLEHGRLARAHRSGHRFTEFDGHVPQAGADLGPTAPTGRTMSANSLQIIGKCPRLFFFKYGLGIEPPDDLALDPNQWLNALARGSLLHELFEQFMREVIGQHRTPSVSRDEPRLQELLAEKITEYRESYPSPSDSVFHREENELQRIAHTFLVEEEKLCTQQGSVPVYCEASLGMPAERHGTPLDTAVPIPIELPNGGAVRIRGRVDRIDRAGPAGVHTYRVWDYKSGSTWGYAEANPFNQGRKIQPYLYVTIVQHRLREVLGAQAEVAYFGFFFPGIKAAGDRLEWSSAKLSAGQEILEKLCQVVANGAFLATTNHDQDCTYCEYGQICGDVSDVARQSQQKLDHPENTVLVPMRALRSLPAI
jgi:ATP-dependent helicase/nuclease subunit B